MIINSEQKRKAENGNESNFESSEISMIWSLQSKNISWPICETFDGIKKSLIFDSQNAHNSIICKFELCGISTFVRFLQSQNASSHIFVTVDGIKISLMFDS